MIFFFQNNIPLGELILTGQFVSPLQQQSSQMEQRLEALKKAQREEEKQLASLRAEKEKMQRAAKEANIKKTIEICEKTAEKLG